MWSKIVPSEGRIPVSVPWLALLFALVLVGEGQGQEESDRALASEEVYRRTVAATGRVRVGGVARGAGFRLDPTGLVVTAYHLIEKPSALGSITVEFARRTASGAPVEVESRNARVVAIDGRRDIVLLEIEGEGGPALPLAPSGALEGGERVYALGHPTYAEIELPFTFTEGVVSSTRRRFEGIGYIQTDAAVNPGTSGGPLVDRRARVVGVVNRVIEPRRGLAFALSVAEVAAVVVRSGDREAETVSRSEIERVVRRWFELAGDQRYAAAGELLAPYYHHDQVVFYRDLLVTVRREEAVASRSNRTDEAIDLEVDRALRRASPQPHRSRLLREVLGRKVDRPGIRAYLVRRFRVDLGEAMEWKIGSIEVRGALADVRVRGRRGQGEDVERWLRLVRDDGQWSVVPVLLR